MANDPNTIQYVIQEDGFWYIASKEKNPYVPELTVSAKGVANGLSTEYNDGYDFGPDSYDPTSTATPPYTQTSGMQEAWNYSLVNGNGEIVITTGRFYIYSPLFLLSDNQVITIKGSLNDGDFLDSTTNFPIIVNRTSGTVPYVEVGSTSSVDMAFGLSHIGFLGNASASDGIVTVNVMNFWNNVNTYNFGSKYAVRSMGGGDLQVFRDCWINGDVSASGNSVFRLDGQDTVPTYTIGTTTITVSGRPETYFSAMELAGNKASYASGTVLLDIADANLFSCSYLHLRNGDTGILDENSYANIHNPNLISSLFPENLTTLITANGSSESAWIILPVNANYPLIQTANYSNGNIVKILPNPVVPLSPSLAANPPVSGTTYQNTNPYTIEIDLPTYATTAGTAGSVTIYKGSTDSPTAIGYQYVSGDTSSASEQIITLRVPAGWYYGFTASGVTLGTASVYGE